MSPQGNTAGRIRDHVLLPSLGRENTCHLKGTQQGEFETMSCCRPWDEKTRVTSREHSRENSRPCPVAVLRTRKHVSPQGNTTGRIRDHVLLPSLGRENTCHLKGTQQGEFETMSCCRPQDEKTRVTSREHSRENSRPCPVAVLTTRKHVSPQGNTAGRIRDHVLLPSLGRENTCQLKGTQQGEFETMSCCRP